MTTLQEHPRPTQTAPPCDEFGVLRLLRMQYEFQLANLRDEQLGPVISKQARGEATDPELAMLRTRFAVYVARQRDRNARGFGQ